MQQRIETRYLTPAEVAEIRRMKESSLAQERFRGLGPRYVKDGRRVLYPVADFEAWFAKQLRPGNVA